MKIHGARYWIRKLDLKKHTEGGYYKEIYKSDKKIKINNKIRNFYTSIYYLLESNDFSSFHKIKSDEIWNFFTGSAITIYFISKENGKMKKTILGPNFECENNFQVLIPANTWFAAKVDDLKSYALVGCIVSPGFEFDDFELGRREKLEKDYPKLKNLIKRFTR